MRPVVGLALGFVAGVAFGLLHFLAALPYLGQVSQLLTESEYRRAVEQGVPPDVARQGAQAAAVLIPLLAGGASALLGGFLMAAVGAAMALLWGRLRPWYLNGAAFGVLWLALSQAARLAAPAAPEAAGLPQPPDPPPWLAPLQAALDLLTPIFAAYLMHRREAAEGQRLPGGAEGG